MHFEGREASYMSLDDGVAVSEVAESIRVRVPTAYELLRAEEVIGSKRRQEPTLVRIPPGDL